MKKPFFNISEAKLAILPHKNKRISNKKMKERFHSEPPSCSRLAFSEHPAWFFNHYSLELLNP